MNCIDWTYAYTGRLSHNISYSNINGLVNRLQTNLASGTLPFLDLTYMHKLSKSLPQAMARLPKVNHLILLGIGGSALGARALQKAFFPAQDRPGHSGPYLWIADNIDAHSLSAWMTTLSPKDTIIAVISKSGGTIETLAQYFLLKDWLQKELGDTWKKHVVIITDESLGPLRQEATVHELISLPVPEHLGGRYSVLSAVGLFPAAFLGIDWQALVHGAQSVLFPLIKNPVAIEQHLAFSMASWAWSLMNTGYSQLIFFNYIPLWSFVGQWFSQLWAESLGKAGKGSMPLPAVGVTDQHSLQQMFLDGPKDKGCIFISTESLTSKLTFSHLLPEKWSYLNGKYFDDILIAEALGTRMALTKYNVPLLHVNLGNTDEEACGKLMGLCMATTLLAGWMLAINPLDQPAVELGKRLTNARLGACGYESELRDLTNFLAAESNEKQYF